MTTSLQRAFFEHLAATTSAEAFARTKAGVAALELYDSVKQSQFAIDVHGPALARIARCLRKLRQDMDVRVSLLTLIDVIPLWCSFPEPSVGRSATYAALLQYGLALAAAAEWNLAREIYLLVAIDAELDHDVGTAAQARFLAGRACRMCADWDSSAACYARAIELGIDAGDLFISFRAEIGQANNMRSRGDLPGTERQLIAIIRRARRLCPEAVPHAIIAQAALANSAGQHERAIDLARQTLELATHDDQLRAHALVDIANFLADYGLPTVATEALKIVAATAPEQGVRTHAVLNLFFLAANKGNVTQLDTLRYQLQDAALTPRQQTQFALFDAQGLRNIGCLHQARETLASARHLAQHYKFFQLSFDVEEEAKRLDDAACIAARHSKDGPAVPAYQAHAVSFTVRRAVEAVHSLCVSMAAKSTLTTAL